MFEIEGLKKNRGWVKVNNYFRINIKEDVVHIHSNKESASYSLTPQFKALLEDAQKTDYDFYISEIQPGFHCFIHHKLGKQNTFLLFFEEEVWCVHTNEKYKNKEDGPAFLTMNGYWEWWLNGKKHRVNGPATSEGLYYFDGLRFFYNERTNYKLVCLFNVLEPQFLYPKLIPTVYDD
jgi:hypothetical protein